MSGPPIKFIAGGDLIAFAAGPHNFRTAGLGLAIRFLELLASKISLVYP
jgi:hypothetical protein